MALLNEILGSAARFNQLLTRKFNITGGAPAPQLTPEIGAGYSMDRQPEDHILSSEMLASSVVAVTGAAGQSGAVALQNNSQGLAIVVEQILVTPGAAITNGINVSVVNSAGLATVPAAGALTCRDTRVPLSGAFTRLPAGIVRSSTNTPPTAGNGNIVRMFGGAGTTQSYFMPIILGPPLSATAQWQVIVVHLDVAASMVVHFAWREVPLSPGEFGPF